jgi:hypothetical protein
LRERFTISACQCLLWVNRDQVIEVGSRGHVRFDPDSDHDRTALQYVATGQQQTCLGVHTLSNLGSLACLNETRTRLIEMIP